MLVFTGDTCPFQQIQNTTEFRTQVEQANKDIEREEKLLTFYDSLVACHF